MRYDYLSPHHFQTMSAYFDTTLVVTAQPHALDVAVPHAASGWIGQELARRLQSRFLGRMSSCEIGFSSVAYGIQPTFYEAIAAELLGHKVRFGIVLLDRQTIQPFTLDSGKAGIWLFADWWQWFHRMVPKSRLSDVWMYLCHACPNYWHSPERRALKIPDELSASMQAEGNRLFDALVAEISSEIAEMWNGDVLAEQTDSSVD